MKKFRIQILSDEGCRLMASSDPFFLGSQQADIMIRGQKVGQLGIVHPKVLKAWDWQHPIAML